MKKTSNSKMLQVSDFYMWLQRTEEVTELLAKFIVGYTKSSSNNPIATFLKQKHSLYSAEIESETLILWNGEDTEAYIEPVPKWAKQFLELAGQQPYEGDRITVKIGEFPVEIDLSKAVINQSYDYDGDVYYESNRLMTNRRAISILEAMNNKEVSKAMKQVDTQREKAASDYFNWMSGAQRRARNEWGDFDESNMRNHFPDEETYQNWVDSSD